MASFQGDSKAIFLVFIGTIITAVILSSIATQVVLVTEAIATGQQTVTGGAANSTTDLNGRGVVGSSTITNVTNGTTVTGAKIVTGISETSGLLSVQLIINDTSTGAGYTGGDINVSYTYEPNGYISTSGGRIITILITLFSALAVLVFVIVIFIKHGSMGRLMGRG